MIDNLGFSRDDMPKSLWDHRLLAYAECRDLITLAAQLRHGEAGPGAWSKALPILRERQTRMTPGRGARFQRRLKAMIREFGDENTCWSKLGT